MFTGPVGPVEVFIYWPEAVFGNFYWPGAIGSPLASSPQYVTKHCFYVAKAVLRLALEECNSEIWYHYKQRLMSVKFSSTFSMQTLKQL